MYFLSKWDICGLIISNEISAIFLINCNLYIVFCGKNIKNQFNILKNDSIISDIDNYIKKCYINKKSMVITTILVLIGYIIKKTILIKYTIISKILGICFIGLVNIKLIYFLEYKNFMQDLNCIKLY